MKIESNLFIECPHCLEESNILEFNSNTRAKCVNREMRRDFIDLTDKRAFLSKNDTHYICPKCNEWSMGCQLKITHTTNKEYLRLGGKPLSKGRR